MDPVYLGIIVGFPLVWHVALTGYVYTNARRYGMNRRRWTAVAFFVPLFGLFAYLFERDERVEQDDPGLFADGPYEIHHSRANDGSAVWDEEKPREESGDNGE